ncbi:MAG TPA: 5-guanidino-2-oxopentanoate decarboxylase [Acidiphilium sp.]
MSTASRTVGEALIDCLEANGVEIVFGIPGVHTVELYRGLANSSIRHITPRHEQGAGFMADGYARVSGKPGVCLLITGPGLTNALTAMAQARADSVPLLVISGVNARHDLGHQRGALHEVPNQHAITGTIASYTHTLLNPTDLPSVMARAFAILNSSRPGPVHIEIPVDVMAARIDFAPPVPALTTLPNPAYDLIRQTAELCAKAERPVILLGGGACKAAALLPKLAERLDAPSVTTVNARGLLSGHPLEVPASPSLKAVREFLADADLVLAIGTEFGPTDFDMYEDGQFPPLANLVRIDIDAAQLARGPMPRLAILSSAHEAVEALLAVLPEQPPHHTGPLRAARARQAVRDTLSGKLRREIAIIEAIRTSVPNCIMVGDSTQLVYAGNLYCEIDRPNGWFNSATGYGALGYAPPAAIGAALGAPDAPVVCIVGDGGIQFSLAELGSAIDAGTNVIFLVWNNRGYSEIELYMRGAGIEPVGVKPTPPDFLLLAQAYGIPAERLSKLDDLPSALERARTRRAPALIEIPESVVHP